MFGGDDQHLAHRLLGGPSFSSPSHSACALWIQQVRILRVLRERLRQHPLRVGKAAALDEIERLLGVDGGTRGLVVHVPQ